MNWFFNSNKSEDNSRAEKLRDLEGHLRELENDYSKTEAELDYFKRELRNAEYEKNVRVIRDFENAIDKSDYHLRYLEVKIDNVKGSIRYYSI